VGSFRKIQCFILTDPLSSVNRTRRCFDNSSSSSSSIGGGGGGDKDLLGEIFKSLIGSFETDLTGERERPVESNHKKTN
ncbi:unnamed protein product, partial [Rotaria magnacalcarata]